MPVVASRGPRGDRLQPRSAGTPPLADDPVHRALCGPEGPQALAWLPPDQRHRIAAVVAAGAVVTRDVPDYALIVGVPGRQRGWVGRHGIPLPEPGNDGRTTCPESGLRYELKDGQLRCLDVHEDAELDEAQRTGSVPYRALRPRPDEGGSS